MMRNGFAIFFLIPMCHSSLTNAYEIDTHKLLSKNAYRVSNLGQNTEILDNLGIQLLDTFTGSEGIPKSIIELIGDGAEFEDTLAFYRPINHFFNPLNGSGLTGVSSLINNPSPDWALEDTKTIGLQDYSYRDAREYFYKALTEAKKSDRDKNFGLTFQTVGMVIHHIQDMAQPQHVRNDAHLAGQYIPGIIENKSLYEQYTDRDDVRASLPVSGYPAVYSDGDPTSFNQPRYFWEKPTGEGLAQFTNANFVSAGTNFDNSGMFALQSQEVQG